MMAEETRLKRTYRYRIYPTVHQRFTLESQLNFACQLYNAALEQRRYACEVGARRSPSTGSSGSLVTFVPLAWGRPT